MLSENILKLDFREFADPARIKKRRLKDINRGVEYWRKIDEIADRQWRNHLPAIDALRSRKNAVSIPALGEYGNRSMPTIRARPVYSEYQSSKPRLTQGQTTRAIQSEYSNQRASLLNQDSEWSPQKSVEDIYPDELIWSAVESSSVPTVAPPRSMRTVPPHVPDKISVSRIQKQTPKVKNRSDYTGKIIYSNTWGSLFSPLDQKTNLTEEDKRPREEPPRFRDSVRHLTKPVPRKAVPMSRIGSKLSVKQIKTLTNYRSGNGVISIIKPLDPLPDIQKDDSVDPGSVEDIKKEKTFDLLERIDRMLQPLQKKTKSGCSSEEEICASDDVTPLTPTNTCNTPEFFQPTGNSHVKIHSHGNSSASIGFHKNHRPKGSAPFLLSQPLAIISQRMAPTQQDVQLKCQGWIDRWVDDT